MTEPEVSQVASMTVRTPAIACDDQGLNVQSVAVPVLMKSSEPRPKTLSLKVSEKRTLLD